MDTRCQATIESTRHSDTEDFSDDINVNDDDDVECSDVTMMPHDISYILNDETTASDNGYIDEEEIEGEMEGGIEGGMKRGIKGGMERDSEGRTEDADKFSWLRCTRYKPPKLPRTKRKDTCLKRKLGRNPLVPFTQHQVSLLENKFRQTHYLSSVDVAELSAALNLTETRVKIWFQNRRARERRDKNSPVDLMMNNHSNAQQVFNDDASPLVTCDHLPAVARVARLEDASVTMTASVSPMHNMLTSHWSYYQALHGLYGYRSLATPLTPRSFQYYDVTSQHARQIMALRQSTFIPVTSEDNIAAQTD